MEHSYIDEHSGINSFIHNLEPRIKVLSFFVFILFVIFTPLEAALPEARLRPPWGDLPLTGFTPQETTARDQNNITAAWLFSPESIARFGLYGLLIVFLILLSRIPPGYIFKKSLAVIPFVLLIAIFIPFFKSGEAAIVWYFGALKLTLTREGLVIFWDCLIKAYLSILSMILLTASTKFPELLKALEKLRLPSVLIMVISFMYRYIFVVTDELMAMRQAKESRSPRASRWLSIKVLANMVGVLFIRAYERAENVYLAMCSRGFDGSIKTMRAFAPKTKDFLFLFAMVFFLSVIRIFAIKNG